MPRTWMLGWGLPTLTLAGALALAPTARTWVWVITLVWMGVGCGANALSCGRRHCYLTGPFFLLMAGLTALYGFDILELGAQGWLWLGLALVGGTVGLWWLPEHRWGPYLNRSHARRVADDPGFTMGKSKR